MDYKSSGVDIEAGDNFVNSLAQNYFIQTGFAAELDLSEYVNPIISVSTDGVGSKMLISQVAGNWRGIGIDLVAMVFNDILCTGAMPHSFLDYIAVQNIKDSRGMLDGILVGINDACEDSKAKLVGGETAELSYLESVDSMGWSLPALELAGFGIGVREKNDIFAQLEVKSGDVLVGLPSSGLHANGLSLVRQIITEEEMDLDKVIKFDSRLPYMTLAEAISTPTRIYTTNIRSTY